MELVQISYYITIGTHSAYFVVVFYDIFKLVLRYRFLLEMLSAVLYSKRNYPAMPLA